MVRFGLAVVAYVHPPTLMVELGFPLDANVQAPYLVRVWAIRDMVLSGLLVYFFFKQSLNPLLLACMLIDVTDIFSAYLGGQAGLFEAEHTFHLMLTAIFALLPEGGALWFNRQERHSLS